VRVLISEKYGKRFWLWSAPYVTQEELIKEWEKGEIFTKFDLEIISQLKSVSASQIDIKSRFKHFLTKLFGYHCSCCFDATIHLDDAQSRSWIGGPNTYLAVEGTLYRRGKLGSVIPFQVPMRKADRGHGPGCLENTQHGGSFASGTCYGCGQSEPLHLSGEWFVWGEDLPECPSCSRNRQRLYGQQNLKI